MSGRAAVLRRPRPARELPLAIEGSEPEPPGPADLALGVSACGVCRTDLQLCEGDLRAHRLPVVPGHQIVGRVAQVGDRVQGWKIGDRAGVCWLAWACGECDLCREGRENLCRRARFTGWDVDGGFATHARVNAQFALRLPEGFCDLDAAPLLCGGVIGHRALRLTELTDGARLGLYGFGASARITIQVARHLGIDCYVSSRGQADRERALQLGAAWTGDTLEAPPVALDAAITFAPIGDVVVAALAALAPGGRVIVNAIHLDRIPEFPYRLLWQERRIQSVANVTRRDAEELLALAAEIPITTDTEVHSLEDANLALKRLEAGELAGAAVLAP
ncbi:MAG: zinc-binding alcohol dehydrogenase family protein [Thermoleophilia bacterium]|nr:zinc-binding alcohol dehydrogenase family protein [Thermoleophilia bacterium]MDH3725740.1 zinc-binding alcohol dehydrogenase family protein [Thermoleophilia bacterium]